MNAVTLQVTTCMTGNQCSNSSNESLLGELPPVVIFKIDLLVEMVVFLN